MHDRAPEFASVSWLLVSCYIPSPELLNYHPLRAENGFSKCLRKDDLLYGSAQSTPSTEPFHTQSAESMGALGRFEVVLGLTVWHVNSQESLGNYFSSSYSKYDGENHNPVFT